MRWWLGEKDFNRYPYMCLRYWVKIVGVHVLCGLLRLVLCLLVSIFCLCNMFG